MEKKVSVDALRKAARVAGWARHGWADALEVLGATALTTYFDKGFSRRYGETPEEVRRTVPRLDRIEEGASVIAPLVPASEEGEEVLRHLYERLAYLPVFPRGIDAPKITKRYVGVFIGAAGHKFVAKYNGSEVVVVFGRDDEVRLVLEATEYGGFRLLRANEPRPRDWVRAFVLLSVAWGADFGEVFRRGLRLPELQEAVAREGAEWDFYVPFGLKSSPRVFAGRRTLEELAEAA